MNRRSFLKALAALGAAPAVMVPKEPGRVCVPIPDYENGGFGHIQFDSVVDAQEFIEAMEYRAANRELFTIIEGTP